MVTGRPTWDLQRLVSLLAALGVRNLDLRLNPDLDDMQLLINHSDVLTALRRYRNGLAMNASTGADRRRLKFNLRSSNCARSDLHKKPAIAGFILGVSGATSVIYELLADVAILRFTETPYSARPPWASPVAGLTPEVVVGRSAPRKVEVTRSSAVHPHRWPNIAEPVIWPPPEKQAAPMRQLANIDPSQGARHASTRSRAVDMFSRLSGSGLDSRSCSSLKFTSPAMRL